MRIADIIKTLEAFAPLPLQESYDNAGLYTGHPDLDVQQVLLTLDITEEVVEEAILKGCQMIIAHHPIIFKPLKRLTGSHYTERVLLKAIKHDIALYASHTNLDNVSGGVNYKLAEKLQLQSVRILQPKQDALLQLVVFVPVDHTQAVLEALGQAGAGHIGHYKNCSFTTEGLGRFEPMEGALPHIGVVNKQEQVKEDRVEVVVPIHLKHPVLTALFQAHPYEEVAYYLNALENQHQEIGAGAVGKLQEPMSPEGFLAHLKSTLGLETVKFTPFSKSIQKVAVCGGAGSFLLKAAMAAKADAFVSSDFKYHEFFEADGKILVADIGHYESEFYTKELFYEILTKKIPNIALLFSNVITNPVKYYR